MESTTTPGQSDIGLIGLAVMGQNLVLNMADNGWAVSVFNRSPEKTREFVSKQATPLTVAGHEDLTSFVGSLKRPRKVMLMIKAGDPVDAQIESLLPHLDQGDIIIDGGNSLYEDTQRRCEHLEAKGIRFVGTGVSGGEIGARFGPSIMPGGDADAWPLVEPIFTSIAATSDGEPMAAWVGSGGAGHFVKMVHNGIEYGDMQVIAEAYDLLSRGLGMGPSEMQPLFTRWNQGKLDSYLIEITADILGHKDQDGEPTLNRILDAAGQKGTGKWTVIASMDEAVPVSLVAESVYARIISAFKEQRAHAAAELGSDIALLTDDPADVAKDLHDAVYGSKIVSYAQGFMLIENASHTFGWNLDAGTIAGLWRSGCIIRSRFLKDITAAFRADHLLPNLLLDDFFKAEIREALPGWRRTVSRAVLAGIPVPAYASALAFYDSYRSERLPANLIQAQRDYFGAHTYERIDRPRGEWFHTDWTGEGGDVTSGAYTA